MSFFFSLGAARRFVSRALKKKIGERGEVNFSLTIMAALAVAHPASCATASAPLVKFPESIRKC